VSFVEKKRLCFLKRILQALKKWTYQKPPLIEPLA
jgi:hypothetical protein